jgi:hypothetical protein
MTHKIPYGHYSKDLQTESTRNFSPKFKIKVAK